MMRLGTGPGLADGSQMTIFGSLLLSAIGAILRFAVTAHVAAVNLMTIGTIFIIVVVVGLVISLIWLASTRRRRTSIVEERTHAVPPVALPGRTSSEFNSAGSTTTPHPKPVLARSAPTD